MDVEIDGQPDLVGEIAEGAREAIKVRLHQGALLVLEDLDVALPNKIFGRPSSLRGRCPVLQNTVPSPRSRTGRAH